MKKSTADLIEVTWILSEMRGSCLGKDAVVLF